MPLTKLHGDFLASRYARRITLRTMRAFPVILLFLLEEVLLAYFSQQCCKSDKTLDCLTLKQIFLSTRYYATFERDIKIDYNIAKIYRNEGKSLLN